MKTVIELLTQLIAMAVAILSLKKVTTSNSIKKAMTEKTIVITIIVIFGILVLCAICYIFKAK